MDGKDKSSGPMNYLINHQSVDPGGEMEEVQEISRKFQTNDCDEEKKM